MRAWKAVAAAAALIAGLGCAAPAMASGPAWEQGQHVAGVFDIVGPRGDGKLVVAGVKRLYLVDPSGGIAPFAGGYVEDTGGEAYIALSPGLHVAAASCDFAPSDVFALRLRAPFGVTRIAADGTVSPFATVTGVDTLTGIAFDTTGRFGFRLLVSGPAHGKTTIAAIDCRGGTQVVTTGAPALEGGLAVAPAGFGQFGGALVAPDELSGRIYAIDPDGAVRTIADSGLPTGGDIGVESAGFAPPGFSRGGAAYYADRATPNNPHPGTDSILRLDARTLAGAGVRDGDLLVATEGGATMIAVRCSAAACRVLPVVQAPTSAHGEGHLTLAAGQPGAQVATPARTGAGPLDNKLPAILVIAAAVLAALVGAFAIRRRTRRG
jgi:hypothetical protein